VDERRTRKGWDASKGVECAEERWTFGARRRVVVLKERDVEKGQYRQRGERVFENLTGSNGDGKQSWETTAILKGIGASIFGMPVGRK
jgi:hypothetical protein